MAPAVGLEPTTDRLTADCSTTELRWNNIYYLHQKNEKIKSFFINSVFFGGRYRNRTSIKGFAVLCMSHSANRPLQNETTIAFFLSIVKKKEKKLEFFFQIVYSGDKFEIRSAL